MKTNDIMNVRETLEFLGNNRYPIHKSRLYQLTREKMIPHRKIGKFLVFRKSDVSAWLESKTEIFNPINK